MIKNKLYLMTVSAFLFAIGFLIPSISPIKIIIGPASFTLGSHIAIMIAMFISVKVGIVVTVGTTFGFFLGGFPLVIVMRALSQIIFITIGAYILKKKPKTMNHFFTIIPFAIMLGVIHAVCEIIAVFPFYFSNGISDLTINSVLYDVFLLVGIGTLIHSCIDFVLSTIIYKPLLQNKTFKNIANVKEISLFHK